MTAPAKTTANRSTRRAAAKAVAKGDAVAVPIADAPQQQAPQITVSLPADAWLHLVHVLDEIPSKWNVMLINQQIRMQSQSQMNRAAAAEIVAAEAPPAPTPDAKA